MSSSNNNNNNKPTKPNKPSGTGNEYVPRKGGKTSGPVYDPRTPGAGKKRKATAADPEAKKARINADQAKLRQQLVLYKNDDTRPVAGKDIPSGRDMYAWNKLKHCIIVLRAYKLNPKYKEQKGLDNRVFLFENFKFQYNLSSQTPEFTLNFGGQMELRFSQHNFVKRVDVPEKDTVHDGVFVDELLVKDAFYKPDLVQAAFKEKMDTPGLSDQQAARLIDFGKVANEPTKDGLHCLNFLVQGRISAPRLSGASRSVNAKNKQQVDPLYQLLRKGVFSVTIVNKLVGDWQDLTDYWKHRVREVVNRGIFPYYSSKLYPLVGCQFQVYIADLRQQFPHEPWMASNTPKANELAQYAPHKVHYQFGSLGEREVVLSASTLHEISYTTNVKAVYYSWGKEHVARVHFVNHQARYCQLEVTIKKLPGLTSPPVRSENKFRVRPGTGRADERPQAPAQPATPAAPTQPAAPAAASNEFGFDEADLDDAQYVDLKQDWADEMNAASGYGEEDALADSATTGLASSIHAPSAAASAAEDAMEVEYTGPQWTGRVLAVDSHHSFIIGFSWDHNNYKQFFEGGFVNIELEAINNETSYKRQLQAIAILSKKAQKALGEKDDIYKLSLDRFLLGEGLYDFQIGALKSPIEIARSHMTEMQALIYETFLEVGGLNKLQTQALLQVTTSPKPITLIQGPPGTGKSMTAANIITAMSCLGYKSTFAAPTNQAARAGMRAIINARQKLVEIVAACDTPDRAKANYMMQHQIIYFQTMANTKGELETMTVDEMDLDEAPEDDEFNEYKMSTLVYHSMQRKTQDPRLIDEQRKVANDWLDTWQLIKLGGVRSVPRKILKQFHNTSYDEQADIMGRKRPLIIVSTCNNSAVLREMGVQPHALFIDEAAFGTEPDISVPLALGAKEIVLLGDHQQLKPIVVSYGYNEHASQLELSLFERTIGTEVPLIRLKVNYRMHPDIAFLPGMLSYGWLGCAPNTMEETALFRQVKHYVNNTSGHAKNRRAPVWEKAENVPKKELRSVRRLFFNVPGGYSAAPENTTSLVNFANVNVIVQLVIDLLALSSVSPASINVLTGYVEQRGEIRTMLDFVLRGQGQDVEIRVETIDNFQGDEAEIIICDITAANKYHPSLIGFISKWNRMNVALTRGKQFLWMVGNIDAWRTELRLIAKSKKAKKFALMIIDVLDLGDVIDIEKSKAFNRLPMDYDEYTRQEMRRWSRPGPLALRDEKEFTSSDLKAQQNYRKEQDEYEASLLKSLKDLRKTFHALQARHDAGEDVHTNLHHNVEEGVQELPENEDEATATATAAAEAEAEADKPKDTDTSEQPVVTSSKDKGKGKAVEPAESQGDVEMEGAADPTPTPTPGDSFLEDAN